MCLSETPSLTLLSQPKSRGKEKVKLFLFLTLNHPVMKELRYLLYCS